MLLKHLSLTNFRNFARLDIEVPGGPVLLVGENAQGKTSLLEAIYYLATFTSFHASHDRQLVNFLAVREPLPVAHIIADFQYTSIRPDRASPGSRPRRLHVRLIQESDAVNGAARLRKEILLDGVKRKVGEAIGMFNAVLFLPQMLRIVEGAPEERRRYLNLAMDQVMPGYAGHLSEYGRALEQRNALLKQLDESGGDPGRLDYWDEQVADLGAQVIRARIQAVQELERYARRFHGDLTHGQEVLRLSYQPAYDPYPLPPGQLAMSLDTPVDRSGLSLEDIRQGFLDCLGRLRSEEITRGLTTIGPHRDELRLLGNGIDLGVFGSRGQSRTAVLALKLAEMSWMKEKTGEWPVLLLDEVLAELDPSRRVDLLSHLLEGEQSLLTTTDLDLFADSFIQKSRTWRIHAGRVQD
jgi:DNA replication and repair protein RecF